MAITVPPPSARIYAFPLKAARPANGLRRAGKVVELQRTTPAVFIEAGSGWYHEAAMRETSHPGER